MIKLPESKLCTDNCVYIDRFIWAVIPEAIDKVLSSLTIQVWVKLEAPPPPHAHLPGGLLISPLTF